MFQDRYKSPPSVECADCHQVCPTVANELTSQCTDQCVVVACHDPTHDIPSNCTSHEISGRCDLDCDSATNCIDCNGFDAFLQCCNDYHEYSIDPKTQQRVPQTIAANTWENWDWCNACSRPQDAVQQPAPCFESENHYNPNAFTVPTHHPHQQAQISQFIGSSSLPEQCMWDNCTASFATLSDLVGHVNLVHLHPSGSAPQQSYEVQQTSDIQSCEDFAASLSCLWHDCDTNVPHPVSGPSNPQSASFTLLETHLFRDHLGLDLANLAALRNKPSFHAPVPAAPPLPTPDPSDTGSEPPDEGIMASQPPSRSPTAGAVDIHPCRWERCDAHFATCDELTAHLNAIHVGSGKPRYECFWEGCNRNGTHWFSSKQKICRHLQSHTGHRPFQCHICQQNFSEAATLQQHMRRHTQERPYACDYPGCGKSFAIMGALTIHKRTHNGLKPFKCKFCDKAFSESSNLSKHLRTHTGARPYSCAEPGCGKTFARPDQLSRHQAVHRKAHISQTVPSH